MKALLLLARRVAASDERRARCIHEASSKLLNTMPDGCIYEYVCAVSLSSLHDTGIYIERSERRPTLPALGAQLFTRDEMYYIFMQRLQAFYKKKS